MKIFNFFSQVFSVFAFLTIGCLLILISLHVVSPEDAQFQVLELYSGSLRSVQEGLVGIVFIAVGLYIARRLIKYRRQDETLIYQGDAGPILISASVIEDTVRKVLKRFHLVKDSKPKIEIRGKEVFIKARLTLWSGGQIQELLIAIQDEIYTRVRKLLGNDNRLVVNCDVIKIEDHDGVMMSGEADKAASF